MAIKKDTLDEFLLGRDPKAVFSKDGLFNELKKALALETTRGGAFRWPPISDGVMRLHEHPHFAGAVLLTEGRVGWSGRRTARHRATISLGVCGARRRASAIPGSDSRGGRRACSRIEAHQTLTRPSKSVG